MTTPASPVPMPTGLPTAAPNVSVPIPFGPGMTDGYCDGVYNVTANPVAVTDIPPITVQYTVPGNLTAARSYTRFFVHGTGTFPTSGNITIGAIWPDISSPGNTQLQGQVTFSGITPSAGFAFWYEFIIQRGDSPNLGMYKGIGAIAQQPFGANPPIAFPSMSTNTTWSGIPVNPMNIYIAASQTVDSAGAMIRGNGSLLNIMVSSGNITEGTVTSTAATS